MKQLLRLVLFILIEVLLGSLQERPGSRLPARRFDKDRDATS